MERSTDHHQGFFSTEFKKLKEKFESTSQDTCFEIKIEYESMKMRRNEDPYIFINTLEKLSRRINEELKMKILNENIITKVLNTLPREYEDLVDSLKVQMATEKVLSLDNLKEQLRSKFHHMRENDSISRIHEEVFHTMDIKQKIVSNTTKNK